MIIALWIVLLVCIVWIALGEMPAGWDGHLPLPYLIALIPFMWIPTLTISIAGFALHEIARWPSALHRCCVRNSIGSTICRRTTLRR